MGLKDGRAARIAAGLILVAALAGCAATPKPEPAPAAPPTAPPPPPLPPPVNLAGKWRLSAASGGACLMTFGNAAGAAEGTIAPAGGCPGNFFTSRKWTFEHGALIIRDHKGEPLAELSFAGDHFEGRGPNGGALTLSR